MLKPENCWLGRGADSCRLPAERLLKAPSTDSCLRHLWVKLCMCSGPHTRSQIHVHTSMTVRQGHGESTCRGSGVQCTQTGTQMEVGRGRKELFSPGDILCPLIPLNLSLLNFSEWLPQGPEKLSSGPAQTRHPQLGDQVTRVPKSLEYMLTPAKFFLCRGGPRPGECGGSASKAEARAPHPPAMKCCPDVD